MAKRYFLSLWFLISVVGSAPWTTAQEGDAPHIQVRVDMVQLNVAVTDGKGNYVTGIRPQDFVVTEDGIPQKIAFASEGNEPARRLLDAGSEDGKTGASFSAQMPTTPSTATGQPETLGNEPARRLLDTGSEDGKTGASFSAQMPTIASTATGQPETLGSMIPGANVFILFDTSNYMYRGFVYAQDAIADFVRSLESPNKVAFYSYSHDLSRASALTSDRATVLRGVRSTVAGDDAALYNSLLLTVKDAAQYTGRKVVVVFSNGPDNASMVPPEDVAELAQSTGIVIYMISTRLAQLEPVSTAVFERMTKATGGKVYFAKDWKEERQAFSSIRDDLAHLYSLSYYPQPNPNRGWRSVTVKLPAQNLKKYHIRTRDGYRLQSRQFAKITSTSVLDESTAK